MLWFAAAAAAAAGALVRIACHAFVFAVPVVVLTFG